MGRRPFLVPTTGARAIELGGDASDNQSWGIKRTDMTSTTSNERIDETWTVNELLQRYPAVLPTLHDLKIHTCCGGGLTLAAAATNAGISSNTLLSHVQAAVDVNEPG